jgi:BASS family bile acid:Na+ symporter
MNQSDAFSAEASLAVQLFIPTAIATITLAMGLGLQVADFRRILESPRATVVGALSQLVLLPAVGFAVAWLFALPAELAVGLVLLTAAPGGPSSNLYTHLARGDVALSVTLTAISGVATIVTIPLVMALAFDAFLGASHTVTMPVGATILQIALVVALPLAVGMGLRARAPAFAARLERVLLWVSVLLLCVLIAGAVAREAATVLASLSALIWPVTAVAAGGMLLGYVASRAARLGGPQAVTVAIEVGMQNAALAIGLAMGPLGSQTMALPAVVYALLAYVACAVWIPIGRGMARRSAAPSDR